MTLSIFLCAYGLFCVSSSEKRSIEIFVLNWVVFTVKFYLFIFLNRSDDLLVMEMSGNIESLWLESSNYPGAVDLTAIWSSSVFVPLVAFSFLPTTHLKSCIFVA